MLPDQVAFLCRAANMRLTGTDSGGTHAEGAPLVTTRRIIRATERHGRRERRKKTPLRVRFSSNSSSVDPPTPADGATHHTSCKGVTADAPHTPTHPREER